MNIPLLGHRGSYQSSSNQNAAPVNPPGQLPHLSPIQESVQGVSNNTTPVHQTPGPNGSYGADGSWYPSNPDGYTSGHQQQPMQQGTPQAAMSSSYPFTAYAGPPPPSFQAQDPGGMQSDYHSGMHTPMGYAYPPPQGLGGPPPILLSQEALSQLLGAAVKAAVHADRSRTHDGDSSGGRPMRASKVSANDFPHKYSGNTQNSDVNELDNWCFSTISAYKQSGHIIGTPESDEYVLDTLNLALTHGALTWYRTEREKGLIVPGRTTFQEVVQRMKTHFMPLPTESQRWREFTTKFGHGSWKNPQKLVTEFKQYETSVGLGELQLLDTLIKSLHPQDTLTKSIYDKLIEQQAMLRAAEPSQDLSLQMAYRLITSLASTSPLTTLYQSSKGRHANAGQASSSGGTHHRHHSNPTRDGASSSRGAAHSGDNRPDDPMVLGAIDGELCSLLSKFLNTSEDVVQKRKKDKQCVYCGEPFSDEHFRTCAKKKEFRAAHPVQQGNGKGGQKDASRFNRRK